MKEVAAVPREQCEPPRHQVHQDAPSQNPVFLVVKFFFVVFYSSQDRIEGGEQRWQTIGMVHGVVLLLVAHTETEMEGHETIRIVSARKADKTERRIYEQG